MSASGRVFWSLVILAMVALAAALPLAVRHRFEGVWIPSTSMVPTLQVGDYVLIDKAAHWPARGDLVVFTDASDPSELLVKRIVGLGGEEITVQGHEVYINCEPPLDGVPPGSRALRRLERRGACGAATWPGSRSRPGPCS